MDFWLYERNVAFLKDRWLDIVLTLPFFTVFRALKGLKPVKSFNGVKTLKSAKLLKLGKGFQKARKLVKKRKKVVKKSWKYRSGSGYNG